MQLTTPSNTAYPAPVPVVAPPSGSPSIAMRSAFDAMWQAYLVHQQEIFQLDEARMRDVASQQRCDQDSRERIHQLTIHQNACQRRLVKVVTRLRSLVSDVNDIKRAFLEHVEQMRSAIDELRNDVRRLNGKPPIPSDENER